jgi:hypothetical protein
VAAQLTRGRPAWQRGSNPHPHPADRATWWGLCRSCDLCLIYICLTMLGMFVSSVTWFFLVMKYTMLNIVFCFQYHKFFDEKNTLFENKFAQWLSACIWVSVLRLLCLLCLLLYFYAYAIILFKKKISIFVYQFGMFDNVCLKVPSGQIGSKWEWYHWKAHEKDINRYMFLIF